jgi:hypothetical protein
VGVDELRHRLRVGLIAIVCENLVLDKIGDIGSISEGFRSRLLYRLSGRPKHDAGEFDAETVGELASSTEELERNLVNGPAFDLDENPYVLVAAEMLGKLLFHGGPA